MFRRSHLSTAALVSLLLAGCLTPPTSLPGEWGVGASRPSTDTPSTKPGTGAALRTIDVPWVFQTALKHAGPAQTSNIKEGSRAVPATDDRLSKSIHLAESSVPPLRFVTNQSENAEELAALARVNAHRKAAGLKPVVNDPALIASLKKHLKYLVTNANAPAVTEGLGAHNEDLNLPNSSAEGALAGKASNLWQGVSEHQLIFSVDAWMNSFYHRIAILSPYLSAVGPAILGQNGKFASGLHFLNLSNERVGPNPIAYPADLQHDVPICWSHGENPNPIPEDVAIPGYPITLTFETNVIEQVSASLIDSEGKPVALSVSSPENPVPTLEDFQGSTICLIPKTPLRPDMSYKVTISAMVNHAASKTWRWSFETMKAAKMPTGASLNKGDIFWQPAQVTGTVSRAGTSGSSVYLLMDGNRDADLWLSEKVWANYRKAHPDATPEGLIGRNISVVAVLIPGWSPSIFDPETLVVHEDVAVQPSPSPTPTASPKAATPRPSPSPSPTPSPTPTPSSPTSPTPTPNG